MQKPQRALTLAMALYDGGATRGRLVSGLTPDRGKGCVSGFDDGPQGCGDLLPRQMSSREGGLTGVFGHDGGTRASRFALDVVDDRGNQARKFVIFARFVRLTGATEIVVRPCGGGGRAKRLRLKCAIVLRLRDRRRKSNKEDR
jgi:hypothetical protein